MELGSLEFRIGGWGLRWVGRDRRLVWAYERGAGLRNQQVAHVYCLGSCRTQVLVSEAEAWVKRGWRSRHTKKSWPSCESKNVHLPGMMVWRGQSLDGEAEEESYNQARQEDDQRKSIAQKHMHNSTDGGSSRQSRSREVLHCRTCALIVIIGRLHLVSFSMGHRDGGKKEKQCNW